MAEYQEKIYVRNDGQESITLQTIYASGYIPIYPTNSYKWVNWIVPYPDTINGANRLKELILSEPYAYVTARSGSASGSLPNGGPFLIGLAATSNPTMEAPWMVSVTTSQLQLNAYNKMLKKTGTTSGGTPQWLMSAMIGAENGFFSNVKYSGSVSVTFHGPAGANKPYIIATFADVVPVAENREPASGFVDEEVENIFRWKFGTGLAEYAYVPAGREAIKQASAKFRWRVKGTETYQEVLIDGGDEFVTIPADTFPNDASIEWNVALTSNDGVAGGFGSWITLTTVDSNGQAIPVSPRNAYVDNSEPIKLEWAWNIPTGSAPHGADFQISRDEGITWLDLGSSQGGMPFVAEPNTLPSGSVQWRLRGYNSDDVAGPWSEAASVIVNVAPLRPSISSVTNKPQPTVRWQSDEQQAYQLRMGDYTSGPHYGTEKVFQSSRFFDDGPLTIGIRVQNMFGLWSSWADVEVTIQNTQVPAIELSGYTENNGVCLDWKTPGEHAEYIVYRNELEIGRTKEMGFMDYAAVGENLYRVRGVSPEGDYAMSNAVEVALLPAAGIIAAVGEWDWVLLNRRRGAPISKEMSEAADVVYIGYSGRKLPVAEISPAKTKVHRLMFSFKSREDAKKIMEMSGKSVVFKWRGEAVSGILGNVTALWDKTTDISFEIVEVDNV